MFNKDDYLVDRSGRYEYETLYWYDGPQLFARYDTVKKQLRLFVAIDEHLNTVSGAINEHLYNKIKTNQVTLKNAWEALDDYKRHSEHDDYWDGEGEDLSLGEAWDIRPLGDAYLTRD